jgi:hypothetical protein
MTWKANIGMKTLVAGHRGRPPHRVRFALRLLWKGRLRVLFHGDITPTGDRRNSEPKGIEASGDGAPATCLGAVLLQLVKSFAIDRTEASF